MRALANFYTRLTNWEYWPFGVVYFPIFFYWLWLSLRARSFFFFSAANPSIETGGMLGESKFDILKKINPRYLPKTLFIEQPVDESELLSKLSLAGLDFPVIAKPNVGERGWLVEKINNREELLTYLSRIKMDFIVQEYVDYPLELGVFYYRFPGQGHGTVSSIVVKAFLTLVGDGRSTLRQLIEADPRARLQYDALDVRYGAGLDEVLPARISRLLEPIGNHCRGTKFLNGNSHINEAVQRVFDRISREIPGFYFGRYDLRCRSWEDLERGEHIRIVELNGAGAGPGHIYDPSVPIVEAYRSLFHHWTILFRISRANNRRGNSYMSWKDVRQHWRTRSREREQHQP